MKPSKPVLAVTIFAFSLGVYIGQLTSRDKSLVEIAREQETKDKFLSSILYTTFWCIRNNETRNLCDWTQQWTTNKLRQLNENKTNLTKTTKSYLSP